MTQIKPEIALRAFAYLDPGRFAVAFNLQRKIGKLLPPLLVEFSAPSATE